MKVTKRKYFLPAIACLLVIAGCVYYYFFSSMTGKPDKQYLYVDADDNVDSVFTKLHDISTEHGLFAFQTLARHFNYADKIRTGRYAIAPGEGAFMAFRHIKNGLQEPLNLTIPTAKDHRQALGNALAKIDARQHRAHYHAQGLGHLPAIRSHARNHHQHVRA